MRRGELLALRWREVDLVGKSIQVTRTLVRTGKKGYEIKPPKSKMSRRVIPIDKEIGAYLSTKNDGQELVFHYADGSFFDPSSVTHTFKKIAAKAGFPGMRFHE